MHQARFRGVLRGALEVAHAEIGDGEVVLEDGCLAPSLHGTVQRQALQASADGALHVPRADEARGQQGQHRRSAAVIEVGGGCAGFLEIDHGRRVVLEVRGHRAKRHQQPHPQVGGRAGLRGAGPFQQ